MILERTTHAARTAVIAHEAQTRTHPLYVLPRLREAIAAALTRLPAGLGALSVRRKDARSVLVALAMPQGELHLRVTEHGDEAAPALARGPVYAAAIERSGLDLEDPRTAALGRQLVQNACRALAAMDQRGLIVSRARPSADPTAPVVHLEPDDFGRWLRAILPREALGEWSLAEIRVARGGNGLILQLTERAGRALEVWVGQSGGEALFDTGTLSLFYLATDIDAERAAQVVFEIGMHIEEMEPTVRIRPSRGSVLLTCATAAPHSFQVSLSGPCHQSCSFCCLDPADRQEPAPVDPEPWLDAVRDAGRRGARILRVNGIEPLRAAFVPEILETAQRSGFERIEIKSTLRPLADPGPARRLLCALSVPHRIDVPLYGSTAELHDRIAGAHGAFVEVMRAVDNLRALASPSCELRIETILLPENAADLPALRALADRLGFRLALHLAHPTGVRAAEVYPRSIVRFRDAARAIFPSHAESVADVLWGELPVCVEVARERDSGAHCVTTARLERRAPSIAGVHYASTDIGFASAMGNRVDVSATLPCPHGGRCFARVVCGAEVYALYAAHAGLDEFAPLAREDLAALREGPALLAAIDRAWGSPS